MLYKMFISRILLQLKNRAGVAECKAKLDVKPSQESKDKAPIFASELKDLDLEEEMEAKFKVKVKGEPMPEVAWYVNDTEVTSSEGIYVVTYEEGKCSLTIKSVTCDMNGKVTCKVYFVYTRNVL